MMEGFTEYARATWANISLNELFLGIVLAVIATDLIGLRDYILKKSKVESTKMKIFWYILSYIFIIPIALLVFTAVLFFL